MNDLSHLTGKLQIDRSPVHAVKEALQVIGKKDEANTDALMSAIQAIVAALYNCEDATQQSSCAKLLASKPHCASIVRQLMPERPVALQLKVAELVGLLSVDEACSYGLAQAGVLRECARLLQHDDVALVRESLEALVNLVALPQNTSKLAECTELVPALIAVLKRHTSDAPTISGGEEAGRLSHYALHCLSNMAHSATTCNTIVHHKTLPVMCKMVEFLCKTRLEEAASSLGYASLRCLTNLCLFERQSVIEANVLQLALRVLSHCGGSCKNTRTKEVLESWSEVTEQAVKLLSNLVEGMKATQEAANSLGAEAILNKLRSGANKSLTSVIRTTLKLLQPNQDDKENSNISQISCASCKAQGKSNMKACGRCKTVRYCSRQCQVDHWKTHKLLCKPTT